MLASLTNDMHSTNLIIHLYFIFEKLAPPYGLEVYAGMVDDGDAVAWA